MKNKLLSLVVFGSVLVIGGFFAERVAAEAYIVNYTLNEAEQSVWVNPDNNASTTITVNANELVEFTRLYICYMDDVVCNSGSTVKWFSQNEYATSVTRIWNERNASGTPVLDHEYRLKVKITDQADNSTSVDLWPHTITVDTVDPNLAEIVPVLEYTNDNTPSLTINVEAGADWEIKSGIDVLAHGVGTNSNEVITLDENGDLPDGDYQFILFTATDAAQNQSAIWLTPFTIDTIAPTMNSATLITPSAEGIKINGGSIYEITWAPNDVTDENLRENPIKLEFSARGDFFDTIIIAENLPNNGSYFWNVPTNLNTRTAKVKITATDLANNYASDESDNNFSINYPLIFSGNGNELKNFKKSLRMINLGQLLRRN